MSLEAYWGELVTGALLGTDRRDPPDPPAGPIADLVADSVRPDPAGRMLAAVSSVAAVRRAAFVPLAVADRLQTPDADPRPLTPASSTDTLRRITGDWPVLEDEWLLTVVEQGWRLAPDQLVDLLLRHRGDAVRRARVVLAAGPLAAWLAEQVPALAAAGGRSAPVEAVTSLPELSIPPDLAELLAVDAHTFVRRLLPGFEAGGYGPAHRAVLINLLARCRPDVLADAAAALARIGVGMAFALADLARLRRTMLGELSETPRP